MVQFPVCYNLPSFQSFKMIIRIQIIKICNQHPEVEDPISDAFNKIKEGKEISIYCILSYHISFQGSYFRYTQNRYGHIPKHTCMSALIHARTHACACTHDLAHGILRPTSVVKVSFFRDWRKVVISLLTCSLCLLNLLIHVDIC